MNAMVPLNAEELALLVEALRYQWDEQRPPVTPIELARWREAMALLTRLQEYQQLIVAQ